MRAAKSSWFAAILLLALPSATYAAQVGEAIQFKPGEISLLPFLEMVSEKLDLQIDASGLGGPDLETITVPDTGPLSLERAKAVVLTCLYLQGYTWIHDAKSDLYRVLRQRDARDQELPVITDAKQLPDNDLLVSFFLRIDHTSPELVARNLRSFMPANSRIIPNESIHTVVITDTGRNISKLLKLVERLDTPEEGKQAKDWLAARARKAETACPPSGSDMLHPQPVILIALFSLIALVIGFLARGYVIRRIEGGL